jgi:predicted transcriptional regulator
MEFVMKPMTKNRAALLRLFFGDLDGDFYMHEIGRILGKKPGVFQRTLNNLVAEGVVESEYRANARYFYLNKNYPFFNELKTIVLKTVGGVGKDYKRPR